MNLRKTPKLRFSEFQDEWKLKQLSSLIEFTPREVSKPFEPYLALGVRSHYRGIFQKPNFDPASNAMESLFVVKEGDLVVNITFAWEKAVALASKEDDGGLVSHRFPTFRFIEGEVNSRFFKYIFPTERFAYELGLASPGGAGRNRVLNKSDFLKIKMFLPQLREQAKIADFLAPIDEKILSLQKKVKLLQQHKANVTQAIFSQKIRFKNENGQEYPVWQEKKLGEFLVIKHGRSQKEVESPNGKYPILATGGEIGRTDVFLYSEPSVLIGRKGTINRPQFMDSPFWTVDTLFYSQVLPGNVAKFFFYVFTTIDWQSYNEGSGVPSLSASTISSIKVSIPSEPEQQKIADFLTSIDDKISLVQKELEQAKKFKKALLQEMFV